MALGPTQWRKILAVLLKHCFGQLIVIYYCFRLISSPNNRNLQHWYSSVWYICGKHFETTACTECTCTSRHIQEASWSYSFVAQKPPLAANRLPYRLQGGFTSLQSTVNWQPSYLQALVSNYTPTRASIIKAASLTEATSENWNCKACVQPSCFNCLEWSAAQLTFCWDIRMIQICNKELAFTNCFRSNNSFFSNDLWSVTKFISQYIDVTTETLKHEKSTQHVDKNWENSTLANTLSVWMETWLQV